jgi:hypothetical protein
MDQYSVKSSGYDSTFPDPLASHEAKVSKAYGLQYAKAIYSQWGSVEWEGSLYGKRWKEFEISRDYANGTQDTSIYKQILTSLDPNNGDGSLVNLDWTPVPIVPKFVKIVVNKILSSKFYPNVEAVDPLSRSEKDYEKNKMKVFIDNKDVLKEAKESGLRTEVDPDQLPDTAEETEIFLETNIKTAAEVAAQIGINLTLSWNDFDERVFRRNVEDLVTCGMAVTKRSNDPNYGIVEEYVDPAYFVHSFTDDPTFSDIIYAGHMKRMSISELKRVAGNQFTEDQYEKMARTVMNRFGNDANRFMDQRYDAGMDRYYYGYDEYTINVLDFEYVSVDNIIFEKKESRFGNVGFYYKGHKYNAPQQSVYDREAVYMQNQTLYGGCYILGTEYIYDYGVKKNIPKNVHDLSRTRMSYSVMASNIRRMIPKSMVSSIIGFADQLQITHLKLQQSIAKAKPDGLIVDIEGLENVQLGRGGELQPLDIQDIYEQTGIFYYRSKNADGSFQNPPIRPLDNSIRNINELITIYNHALRMIRDATGINEVMDGTSPKGDQLVGVRQQQLAAGNNALYDITNAAIVLYRKICEDVVKCLQILPEKSILYQAYETAIGRENMAVLSSFSSLPMYNFGVRVVNDMGELDRMYLEQNIQASIAQGELDIEDAIAIRQLRDVDQAERLLIVRRKKRMKMRQEMAQQNSQFQAQANAQVAQVTSQAKMQEEQMKAQLEAQKIQLEGQVKAQMLQLEYQLKMELARLQGQFGIAEQQIESGVRQTADQQAEDRKDDRIKEQAVAQSKLIAQRKGERPELNKQDLEGQEDIVDIILNQ